MLLFDNNFYSDRDCDMVHKTRDGWSIKAFKREILNRSKECRTPFQRDLDNLTFCGAFRRLQGKTQVRRVGPECFSRTRLSHSIEIARIAESIVSKAHILADEPIGQFIDSDLVAFACFTHDIGNPPFGHAGERELHKHMLNFGGFEGNAQSLRIITETAWATGGIRPTRASVESILKHKKFWKTKYDASEERPPKFLYDYQTELLQLLQIPKEPTTSLECQIMDLADDIGNALIDFSDAARAGIITEKTVKSWLNSETNDARTFAAENVLLGFQNGIIMNNFSSVRVQECIKALHISTDDAKTGRSKYKIALSPQYTAFIKSLRQINADYLFTNATIRASDKHGAFIIDTLFRIFRSHYIEKPSNVLYDKQIIRKEWHERLRKADTQVKFRIICDYLSGMTDDYAQRTFDHATAVAL